MIRAVLDVNVLVSALLSSRGTPARILRALVRDNAFVLVLSPAITDELRKALAYPKIRKRIHASDEALMQWVGSLAVIADGVVPAVSVDEPQADPADAKYLEAALEGLADYVVSGDAHLLDLERFEDVAIVDPRGFWEILQERV